ncbi:MAG: hypothetical protein WBL98_12295, partial [Pseudolabrys sp.]
AVVSPIAVKPRKRVLPCAGTTLSSTRRILTTVDEARARLIARGIDPEVLEKAMMPKFPLPKSLPRPGSAQ